jgi:hypothetical protein
MIATAHGERMDLADAVTALHCLLAPEKDPSVPA